MGKQDNIAFLASTAPLAQEALRDFTGRYGNVAIEDARVIVALGGDGFMLQTLHGTQHLPTPVYGMNRGTVGFLMNEFSPEDLLVRLARYFYEVNCQISEAFFNV